MSNFSLSCHKRLSIFVVYLADTFLHIYLFSCILMHDFFAESPISWCCWCFWYVGAEILRLVAMHPLFEVELATGDSKAGTKIVDLYPHLAASYGETYFSTFSAEVCVALDVVFVCLPHGLSAGIVGQLHESDAIIVDLGSDFRLKDASLYPTWYGKPHSHPELLGDFVYGLPELFGGKITSSKRIAATGCNAAAAILSLAPLVSSGIVESENLLVDIKTGISGAGRPPKENTTFCAVNENVTPYAMLKHRHTPEIEQALAQHSGRDISVLFTPHLVPINRGILATCYGRASGDVTTGQVLEVMQNFYNEKPFVIVSERLPATKSVTGSNMVHVTARVDHRTQTVVTVAVLDNLVKGAAGMAIQNANLATGLPEATGLPAAGVYP